MAEEPVEEDVEKFPYAAFLSILLAVFLWIGAGITMYFLVLDWIEVLSG